MKNNRTNRKLIQLYFRKMNGKYNLTGTLMIVPHLLYSRNRKKVSVLIGHPNNPRTEIMTKRPKLSMLNK